MKGPHDETVDLLETLLFTVQLIVSGDDRSRQRIANAYHDARALVATIGLDDEGSARPRIVACFERFNTYKAADDVAAAGWMLTALQERLGERDLDGWHVLKPIADAAADQLPPPQDTAFH